MNILLAIPGTIPVKHYGGAQRVLWWLGKELFNLGHKVYYLVNPGSRSPYGTVIPYDKGISINRQIPADVDLVHLFFEPDEWPEKPFLLRILGNTREPREYPVNTVFLSRNHAERHHGKAYVYNGIDPDDYGPPQLDNRRDYIHFLGKAAWRLKNLKGAIEIARRSGQPLAVIGGRRINIKMGLRITLDTRVKFYGMLGGRRKNQIINGSKGLLFPVLWHEPFGIAIIESLYFGCPVFGTPYGSLPELVPPGAGYLSDSKTLLAEALQHIGNYSRKYCHQYIMERFTSRHMAGEYLKLYETILNGQNINPSNPYTEVSDQKRFLPFHD